MKRMSLIVIMVIVALALSACAASVPPVDTAVNVSTTQQTEADDALFWLENNNNPYAFAGNRFENTDEAIEFVQSLYDVGAAEVLISGIYDEPWRIEDEGGPYADTLIVKLPEDKKQQQDIMKIYEDECRTYFCNDGDEESGKAIGTLTFWWD